jgi:hypothetical protein
VISGVISSIVLERGQTMERSVARSDKSAQYLMRILPYRGGNNVIEGYC